MKYTVEVDKNKNIFWYKEGTKILHREDGPAVEWADGTKSWYRDGKRHREDGPAVEAADGSKWWYLNGDYMTEEEHRRRTQPVKKMTVAEVVKELGYSIEIVEG